MDLIAFALLGAACLVCSLGVVRLVGWIFDRRDAAILRQLREEDLIASANHDVRIARIKRSVRAAAEREVDHA
ncbi:hypothetical protein [Xanthomonas hortorum]|uniref:hypothetical protein n=1 Tax=Xanthomonas hortorum TaxID=56454 RepID=UPI0020437319|nr:hypothetical protein [Xanthomonas hortorum]MCM5563270.1 hypothetical protein [Xanthomonas hortorum pv. pelargonii]MCM5592177.1 hypothetical protein [Xanthomonas hortorum pv. pelargonii]MCM5596382.1 hypothetical protein [Xanthomonas hortorum pv. pelargonii]MCM5617547.1 hypothetical protein [Xanthomonas hortorum pv. pelargonii]MCM5622545.1 hypothetical protein [Xanthomonas hortorum pv. pelargonii]